MNEPQKQYVVKKKVQNIECYHVKKIQTQNHTYHIYVYTSVYLTVYKTEKQTRKISSNL